MAAEMEILTGPACSGKTTALLTAYRATLLQGQLQRRPGRTLWLAPTHLVSQQIREQLRTAQTSVVLAPQVMTFDLFADRILQYTTEVMRSVPPVMQRVLLRGIIDETLAAGKIQYFAGIARTSGFLDVVLGLIAELKREEAWPADFSAACQQRGARKADLESAALYSEYQARLEAHHRYDSEGRFWSARDQLQHGHWGPFPEFDLVVVDGFSDFTHTQYEILGYLAGRAQRMMVSLPWDAAGSRPDLFGKPQVALERLQRAAACRIVRSVPVEGSQKGGGRSTNSFADSRSADAPHGGRGVPPAITHLSAQLFANPREVEPSTAAEGLEILAVTGVQGEVRAIAERVKRLLVQGVAAREIIVAFRPLTDYAPLVREIFAAAGIPFHCDAPEPLNQQPVIKALLAVLQLELEDWPFERLYALLNTGWFRPHWPGWSAERTPRQIARILRQAKVPHGRSAILAAVERAATVSTISATEDADSDTTAQGTPVYTVAARAAECLQRLSDALQPLRQKRDARSWANTLMQIAREFGIAPRSVETDGAVAVTAWETFDDLLFVAAGTEELLGQGQRRLDLAEFQSELSDLLQHQSLPAATRQSGTVQVLEAAQTRGLDIPYFFLGGLTESSFPQRGGDSFLYTEADRRELNECGLSLGHRTAQTQAEMLLFYSIVTRARTQLTLSYPAVSLEGQPLSASPYLTALRDLFAPHSVRVTRMEQLDPVPAVESMLSLADLRIVATAEALQKRPRWFQTLISHREGARAAASIRAAIEMSVERFQTRGFTPFEGMITRRDNLNFLADRYSSRQEFSATQLEGYAQCPFRFWVNDVLKIREPDAPDQFTDHGLRGSIVHEVLVQLHSQLEPTREAVPIEEAAGLFRQLLTARLQSELAETDLLAALLRIEQRLLEEWSDEYAQQWANYHEKIREQSGIFLKPAAFEVSFGTPHPDSQLPEETQHPCLTFGHDIAETKIRGRIDRIDVGEMNGHTLFNIVDYKTGRKISGAASQVKAGRSLQLVLYALATQRLNLVGDNALPIQAGYWFLRDTGWTPIAKPPKPGANGMEQHADWLALVDVLDDLIPRLAAGIRAGQFPIYNSDRDCTTYCPYKTTCRVNQIRPLEETLDKRWVP